MQDDIGGRHGSLEVVGAGGTCSGKLGADPWAALGAVLDAWPRYTADPDVGSWPDTDLPILSMHGELDNLTPIACGEEATRHFTGPNHHYVAFPGSPTTC